MPQSLRERALLEMEVFLAANPGAEKNAGIARINRKLQTDPTDATAKRVLRNLGIPFEDTPPAPEPAAVPPSPAPAAPQPAAVRPPVAPSQPPPEVPPPAEAVDRTPQIQMPREQHQWEPSQALWRPWKLLTGGIPILQEGADALNRWVDPTVPVRERTLGEVWDELGLLQQGTQWKGERKYEEGHDPWLRDTRWGSYTAPVGGQPYQQDPALADLPLKDQLEASIARYDDPARKQRHTALGIQQLGDLPSALDLVGLRGVLTRPLTAVMNRVQRALPTPKPPPIEPDVYGKPYRGVDAAVADELRDQFNRPATQHSAGSPDGGRQVIDMAMDGNPAAMEAVQQAQGRVAVRQAAAAGTDVADAAPPTQGVPPTPPTGGAGRVAGPAAETQGVLPLEASETLTGWQPTPWHAGAPTGPPRRLRPPDAESYTREELQTGGQFGSPEALRARILEEVGGSEAAGDYGPMQLGMLFDLAADPANPANDVALSEINDLVRARGIRGIRPPTIVQEGKALTKAEQAANARRERILADNPHAILTVRRLLEGLAGRAATRTAGLPAEPGAGLRGLNEQEIADFIERRGALEADLQRLETELADARGTTAATPTERVIDQEVGPPLSEVPDLGRDPNLTPPLAAQEGLGPLVRDALDQSPTAEARAAKYAQHMNEVQQILDYEPVGDLGTGKRGTVPTSPDIKGRRSRHRFGIGQTAEEAAKATANPEDIHPQFAALVTRLYGAFDVQGSEQALKHGSADVNKIIASHAKIIRNVMATSGTEQDILNRTRDAYEMMDSAIEQTTLGLIDQGRIVEDTVIDLQFLDLWDPKTLGTLGEQAERRVAPVRVLDPETKAPTTKKQISGIQQGRPAIKPAKGTEGSRVIGGQGRTQDPEGWQMAEDMAVYYLANMKTGQIPGTTGPGMAHARGSLVRAGFSKEQIKQIIDYLKRAKTSRKTSKEIIGAHSLWTQYVDLTYNRLKATEWNAVATAIAKKADESLGTTEWGTVFEQQAAILNKLYQASEEQIHLWANAIADTQRPGTLVRGKSKTGELEAWKQLTEFETPGAPAKTVAEAERPGAVGTTTGPVTYQGYGKLEGTPSLTREFPDKGKHATKAEVDLSQLTMAEVLLKQAKYLRAINAAAVNTHKAGEQSMNIMLYSSPHLISGGIGLFGGAEAGRKYAEEEGWGPDAARGAQLAGTILGGVGGAIAPEFFMGVARKGISFPAKVDAFLMNSLLSSPRSWLKAWTGAHNGALIAGAEKTGEGVIEAGLGMLQGDRARAKAGREAAKNGLGLMKDVAREDLRFFRGSPKSVIRRVYGLDLQTPEGWKQAEDLLGALQNKTLKQALDEDRVDGHLSNALVGRIMRAPDWGFQRLMMDRGFGFEEARRYTLTGQLRSKPGQTALSLLRPQHELGAKVNPGGVGTQAELPWAETAGGATRGDQARSAVGQGLQLGVNLGRRALSPVPRVQMQALEMGGERVLGPVLRGLEGLGSGPAKTLKARGRVLPEGFAMTPAQAITRGIGTGVAGYLGAEAQEHLDPRLAGLSIAAMGPYALPYAMGAGARQAYMTGGNVLEGMLRRGAEEGIPLDLERPFDDLMAGERGLGTVARLFTPALLRDIAGALDPVAEGRVTSPAQLREDLVAGKIDTSTAGGELLLQVANSAPALLGPLAQLLNASPYATDLPAQRLASLDRTGAAAFDVKGLPGMHPGAGGWQALTPSPYESGATAIDRFRTPEDQQAFTQQLIHGAPDPSALGAVGEVAKNALVQTLFPTYQSMKPQDLTAMDPVLEALATYGAEGLPPMAGQVPRPTVSLNVTDASGKPITDLVRRREQDIVQAGAGEQNRRLYEFVRFLMDNGMWAQLTPAQRAGAIERYKGGSMEHMFGTRGGGGSTEAQRQLATLAQQSRVRRPRRRPNEM